MNRTDQPSYIFFLQIASIALIWIFVGAITWWIARLLWLAWRLHDAPDASVGISIVVIPVFLILAGVLTYVFVGLQRSSTVGPTGTAGEPAAAGPGADPPVGGQVPPVGGLAYQG